MRRLHGLPEINAAIREALDGAGTEILTAQPDGPRPKEVLDTALDSVRRQIAQGVSMRTIYQHSARFDEATKSYVRTVTDYGVQVRTLTEFFDRMIIIDRCTVFIAANPERTDASMITEPSVVRFLVDVFERSWDRAGPFPFVPNHAARAAPEVIPPIRQAIRHMLTEGHSDKVVARRLGISERSLQAHIARIKEELGRRAAPTSATSWASARPRTDPPPPRAAGARAVACATATPLPRGRCLPRHARLRFPEGPAGPLLRQNQAPQRAC